MSFFMNTVHCYKGLPLYLDVVRTPEDRSALKIRSVEVHPFAVLAHKAGVSFDFSKFSNHATLVERLDRLSLEAFRHTRGEFIAREITDYMKNPDGSKSEVTNNS